MAPDSRLDSEPATAGTDEPPATEPGNAEPADDRGEYATQSVCELCGSLTPDLRNFNGQLVCSDCRDV